jgi:hypothetical protein
VVGSTSTCLLQTLCSMASASSNAPRGKRGKP